MDEIEEELKNNDILAASIEKNNQIYIYVTKNKDIKLVKQIVNKKMKISAKLTKIKIINKIPYTPNGKYDYFILETEQNIIDLKKIINNILKDKPEWAIGQAGYINSSGKKTPTLMTYLKKYYLKDIQKI